MARIHTVTYMILATILTLPPTAHATEASWLARARAWAGLGSGESKEPMNYVFKMSHGREVHYQFNARPDLPNAPDVHVTYQENHIDSRTNPMKLKWALVDASLTEAEIARLPIPDDVVKVKANPNSAIILRVEGKHPRAIFERHWINRFLSSRLYSVAHEYAPTAWPPSSQNVDVDLSEVKPPKEFVWSFNDAAAAAQALRDLSNGVMPAKDTSPSPFDNPALENFIVERQMRAEEQQRQRVADSKAWHEKRDRERLFHSSETLNEPASRNANGKFIIPNELDNNLNYAMIPHSTRTQPTAVISVGSLRAFNLMAVKRRDFGIAFDYSQQIADFNRITVDLVSDLDRARFLGALLGDLNPIHTREEFLARLDQKFKSRAEPQVPTGNARLDQFLSPLKSPPGSQQSLWLMWLMSIRQYANTPESWNATLFGSEENYEHLRRMARESRIRIVRGSLSGDKSLKAIAAGLKSKNYVVSEIDVSNAIEHVANQEGLAGIDRWRANLAELPTDADTRVLVTVDKRFVKDGQFTGSAQVKKWIYSSFKVSEFSEAIATTANGEILSEDLSRAASRARCSAILGGR